MNIGRPATTHRLAIGAAMLIAGAAIAGCSGETGKDGQSGLAQTARSCARLADTPVQIAPGSFEMGETDVYAEEGPIRTVKVNGFWIDPHEVTNRQFAKFVKATGYVTVAEKPVDPSAFNVPAEQIPPDMLKPGSAVFTPPDRPSNNYVDWWKYVPGASWKKPYGPNGADYKSEEPVVHLAYEDMEAYAKWAGGRIPTEAEWEYAASAGKRSTKEQPKEANSWQGPFPMVNEGTDGFKAIAPVGCYQPNANKLYDMVGNVWEMTADFYAAGHDPKETDNPKGPSENAAYDPLNPDFPSRVIKGGSYLCAPNYCQRYRPAARSGRDAGMGASNVGFRLVYDRKPA